MQESAYRVSAVNKACGLKERDLASEKACVWQDFGMSQINYKTAQQYDFDLELLTSDEKYSIEAGAQVLVWFKDTYRHREPTMWWTRYNCGTKKNVMRSTCLRYRKHVERWL